MNRSPYVVCHAVVVLIAMNVMACESSPRPPESQGCSFGSVSYAAHETFTVNGGCNSCVCNDDGTVICGDNDCADAGAGGASGGPTCSFDASYTYGNVGGNATFSDAVTLSPPAAFALTRTPVPSDANPDDSGSCAPILPACGSDGIDASDIMSDIDDPAVQSLLSMTTTRSVMLGSTANPDDPRFFFQKSGTAGFFVGSHCLEADTGCVPVPAAVSKLVADLTALTRQELLDPSCP